MRLLLDTHVLLWWLADDDALGVRARQAIGDGSTVVAVSAATAWEIAIKQALGKLRAPDNLVEQLEANHFLTLPMTVPDALAAGNLPRHHDDPFDRMLVAQSLVGGFTLVTRDDRLTAYGIDILFT